MTLPTARAGRARQPASGQERHPSLRGTTGPTVVLAPDKFKGSAAAAQVAAALRRGLRDTDPDLDVREHPIADGGEGTVDVLTHHGFREITVPVRGPLGGQVDGRYALRDGTAVVEAASAVGLSLIGRAPDRGSARAASSFGVGQLVADALGRGATQIVLAVGGSASTDGGAGMLAALGACDHDGRLTRGGEALLELTGLDLGDLDPRLARVSMVVASDVDNPLLGPHGAAAVYAPQKGADRRAVDDLEQALRQWADVVAAQVGRDARKLPGAGAAGGLGFGATAALGATITPGIDYVLDLTGFRRTLDAADLVIVGEGSLDTQSLHGKGPLGVAALARRRGLPTVAVAGRNALTPRQTAAAGLLDTYSLLDLEPDPARCMSRAVELLELTGARIDVQGLIAAHRRHQADLPTGATP